MARNSGTRKRATQADTQAETLRPRKGERPASESSIDAARETPPASRISLPSSGLAQDILAREDARAIEPSAAPIVGAPVAAPRAESLAFLLAPAREEKKPVEATEHLVTFLLGAEEYGLDVRLVQEIIRITEVTPVPRAPDFVKGVINLRGRIIPVVDLKRKLGLGEVDLSATTSRVVVAKLRERLVGLLVDGASQVLKVPVSLIEPAPEEVLEVDADYIRGVAKLSGRLVILMDLARVLSLEAHELEPDEREASSGG
jgi:purine-binding chemotaxis protein CheW